MITTAPRLEFDAAGALRLQRVDGTWTPVRLANEPMSVHAVLSGRYAVAGGFVSMPSSSDPSEKVARDARASVDLVEILPKAAGYRCQVQDDGSCTDPVEQELGLLPRGAGPYVCNPDLAQVVRARLNDFQIYTLLSRLAGREAGTRYMDSLAAEHPPRGDTGCQLVVLFNHHYARNCQAIYDLYARRFPAIDFVMPCVAPRGPHYYAYPFGSYQFHGLVHGYLRDRMREGGPQPKTYLFIQDDVLLHPRLSAATVEELLSGDYASMFPFDKPYTLAEHRWFWSERVRNTFQQQNDRLTGNGFEGLAPAVSVRHLHHGVSDCFALRAEIAPDFLDRLAPMLAANLFPEVAIPSALYSATRGARQDVVVMPGWLLWGVDDRAKARDPAFIRDFIASEAAFLHPMKLSQIDEQTLQLIQSTSLQALEDHTLPRPPS